MAAASSWRERSAPRGLLAVAIASGVLAAVCVVTIDPWVARLFARYESHPAWTISTSVLEWLVLLPAWAWAAPLALAAGMLLTTAIPRLRSYAPAWTYVAGVHILSRFLTGVVKDATDRPRPLAWIATGVDATFGEGGVSFPSGHVSLFASIVIPIVVLCPRLSPLLAIVVWIAAARIAMSQHFVSDTIAAVTLVTLVAWALGHAVRPVRSASTRTSRS